MKQGLRASGERAVRTCSNVSDDAVVMLKEHREFYRKVSDVNSIQPTLRVTGTLIGSSRYSMRLEFSSLIIHMY